MKNLSSIEEIVERATEEFEAKRRFEDFELLLLDAGVSEEDLEYSFKYPEGESFPIGINPHFLKQRLRDKNFLLKFATHLYDSLDEDKQAEFSHILGLDGYFLNEKGEFCEDREVFRVNYSPVDHVVTVNNIIVAKLKSFSENDNAMDYLFQRPNKEIKIVNNRELPVKGEKNIILSKKVGKIINQLGFKGLASRLFFPGASSKVIQFRNPITTSELRRRGYKESLTFEELFSPDAAKRLMKKDAE